MTSSCIFHFIVHVNCVEYEWVGLRDAYLWFSGIFYAYLCNRKISRNNFGTKIEAPGKPGSSWATLKLKEAKCNPTYHTSLWHHTIIETDLSKCKFCQVRNLRLSFFPYVSLVASHLSEINTIVTTSEAHKHFANPLHNRSLSPRWRHQMERCSTVLALCAENSSVAGEFPAQRPVKQSFDVFFDLRLNKRLS